MFVLQSNLMGCFSVFVNFDLKKAETIEITDGVTENIISLIWCTISGRGR